MLRREKGDDDPGNVPKGGILADDQGFGKTLSAIALMLSNAPSGQAGRTVPWGTLVVCPVSLIDQWKGEILSMVDPAFQPNVLIYHGPDRAKVEKSLKSSEVVITTYSVLLAEHEREVKPGTPVTPSRRRKKGPLFKLEWFRVILDEAQAIKNMNSKTSVAARQLRAQHRWCLNAFGPTLPPYFADFNFLSNGTYLCELPANLFLFRSLRHPSLAVFVAGTPIQNSTSDMYSLFMFLKYHACGGRLEWNNKWKRSLEKGPVSDRDKVFERFQVILGVILLRRAKGDTFDDGQPIVRLPARKMILVELEFDRDEAIFYRTVKNRVQASLKKFSADGLATKHYVHIFCLLLRLRQACSHPSLCAWSKNAGFVFAARELDTVKETGALNALPAALRARLMDELAPNSQVLQECPVCCEPITGVDGVITACGHLFCLADYESWTERNDSWSYCQTAISDVKSAESLTQVRKEVHAILRRKACGESVRSKKSGPPLPLKRATLVLYGGVLKRPRMIMPEDSVDKPAIDMELDDEVQIVDLKEEKPTAKHVQVSGVTSGFQEDGKHIGKDGRERTFVMTSKIRKFVELIQKMVDETDEKALAFSQWTRMLDLLEIPLRERDIRFARLDG